MSERMNRSDAGLRGSRGVKTRPGPSLDDFAASGRPLPRDVKTAVAIMRAGIGRKLSLAEVAAACGVAERTLHKHFCAFLGLPPLAYWRQLRLTAARAALLGGGENASVTAIAARCGFHHFGRFSVQYRRAFGEAPSATLARGRTAERSCTRRLRDHMEAYTSAARLTPSRREQPSIAVLPPVCAAEPTHRFFADCIAEGIAAALSTIRSMSVVVPRSVQRIAAQDPQQLARTVGARYVLAGRIAQAGVRMRVIMRLLDATSDEHVWGDSFDGSSHDLLALQDRVTDGVVRAILPGIRGVEIRRAQRKRSQDLDAYDLALRAFPFLLASNPDATRRALDLLDQAMRIDPDYALASALAAWCHAQLVVHHGTQSPSEERRSALALIQRAAILDADDPQVLTARCAVHTIIGEVDVARDLIGRALALDPTCGWAWERSGWLKTYIGEPDAGIADFSRAIRLDPSSTSNANRFVGIGSAHFDAGRYGQAAFWMRKAMLEQPGTAWVNRTLSVSYARLGERLAALDALDALRRFCPDVTIGQVVASIPFRPDFLDRVADGLDDLGLPP